MFELWAFFPDVEAIGAIGFSSNDKGDASNPQGRNEIIYMHSSSHIRPFGKYIFGIFLGDLQSNKQIYFNDWKNYSNFYIL